MKIAEAVHRGVVVLLPGVQPGTFDRFYAAGEPYEEYGSLYVDVTETPGGGEPYPISLDEASLPI